MVLFSASENVSNLDENYAFSFMQKISPVFRNGNFFSCLQLKELNIVCM